MNLHGCWLEEAGYFVIHNSDIYAYKPEEKDKAQNDYQYFLQEDPKGNDYIAFLQKVKDNKEMVTIDLSKVWKGE